MKALKLNDYILFLNFIYGGKMDKNGIIECIMANSVGYANGLITKKIYSDTENYYVNILKKQ